MSRYYYDGQEQPSSRGRLTVKDGIIDKIIMMEGMSNTNGQNITFLGEVINELIDVVNKQNKQLLRLNKEED